ncbi:MAG TPA: transglycosylase family protein [Solirubrobacterales bacterium]
MIIHTPSFLVRIGAFAVAVFTMLAITTSSLDVAGAASSGGVTTGGTAESEEPTADSGGDKYTRIWDRTSTKDKRWARKTAECESGKDPNAIGGGGMYRGAFQFMKSTWKSSPKSPGGDPIKFNYKTQAVVAVALKNKDGAGHWPVCG